MTARRPAAARPAKKASPSAAARQTEADAEDDGFVTIEQCGLKLRLPTGGKLPLAAVDCFRAGDNYGGTKAMLGEKQWERLVDAGATADDLDEVGRKLNASSGN